MRGYDPSLCCDCHKRKFRSMQEKDNHERRIGAIGDRY